MCVCVCALTERLRHICYLATDSRVFRTGLMVREKRFSARCDNKKPSWECVLWVAWAQFPPKIRLYHCIYFPPKKLRHSRRVPPHELFD